MFKSIALGLCLAIPFSAAFANYGPAERESIEWCDIWLPHANVTDAKLPRVLLIGDSITRGYYPAVEKRLGGKACVGRLATSAFASDPMLLDEIALVLDHQAFDVIQFDNGMHGWKHTEAEFRAAFPKLVATLRQHAPNAKLLWANTTPLQSGADMAEPATAESKNVERGRLMLKEDLSGRSNVRIAERNAIALEIMKPLGIAVVDLNTPMQGHPEFYNGDVHFNDRGIAIQADLVAAAIEKALLVR